jgi:hypothetical protein
MDDHPARSMSTQAEMKAKIDVHEEKMEIVSGSSWRPSNIGCNISCRVSIVRHKKMTEKTDETQVDLQEVKMSLDTRTKNFQETLRHIKDDFREEVRTMKAEIRINQ